MNNNKQSSVEWLVKVYLQKGKIDYFDIQQAKAMHKEEIAKSHFEGANKLNQGKNVNGYEYYEQTYEKPDSTETD